MYLGDNYRAALIWEKERNYETFFVLNRNNMSSQFYKYRVEYSNQLDDGAYVRFDREESTDVVTSDNSVFGPIVYSDQWIWSNFPSCNRKYDADANRCSLLAPFDNTMNIVIDIVIGGEWCGEGVNSSHYDVLDRGVEMEISSILISGLYFDNCS
jgi:hypothetical protein